MPARDTSPRRWAALFTPERSAPTFNAAGDDELGDALERGELVAYYQPVVTNDGRLAGTEPPLRRPPAIGPRRLLWPHPESSPTSRRRPEDRHRG